MSLWSGVLTALYLINLVVVLPLLFIRKNDTSTTLAWLLVFIFLPYIGFVLYFFFGSRAKYKILTRRYAVSSETLDKIPLLYSPLRAERI